MWKSRVAIIRKKPRIVLDKSFPATSQLNMGDRGQLLMKAVIDGERTEFQEDDVERIIKTVRIIDVKLLENKPVRT